MSSLAWPSKAETLAEAVRFQPMVAALTTAFLLWSPVFADNHAIPARFTCDRTGASPPLRWKAPPRGTRAFALFVIDLDAGPFTHWTLWDLPQSTRRLPSGTR